jgi:nucleoside-diphosphate-sugar epimerase
MIAVVTGGSGFIGTNLVERLLAGGAEVRCLRRPGGGEPPGGASSRVLDLADAEALGHCEWLDDADVVFHVAGATRAVRERDFMAANVAPTRALLDAMRRRRCGARLVYVSSQAAAGPARDLEHPVREGDAPAPIEAYGRSKLAAERLVLEAGRDLPVTIVRPASVLGPRDRDFLVLFRMAQRGLVFHPGNAEQWISLADVADVVAVLLAAAVSPSAQGRTYFAAGHGPLTWRGLADAMAAVTGTTVRHRNLPRALVESVGLFGDLWGMLTRRPPLATTSKVALARPACWVCSDDRSRIDLGVRPARSLPAALEETYYWYLQHGWLRGDRRVASGAA